MTSFSKLLKAAGTNGAVQPIRSAVFPALTVTIPEAPKSTTIAEPEVENTPSPEPETPVIPNAESRAAEIISAAQAEAEKVLAEARREADSCRREAESRARVLEAEAREKGAREGLETAREAQCALLEDLEKMRRSFQEERDHYFEELEPEVVRLAVAMAEKIIRQEVSLHPEIVAGVARAAIDRLRDARTVRVRAHAADVEILRRTLPDTLPRCPESLEIQASAQIERGGCLIESERGNVDARLNQQCARVAAAMQDDGPQ